jgi:hypothetical protein
MEDLVECGVCQQRLEPRRRPVLAIELHEVGAVVAGGELDHAQPIAMRLEAERLGVDGHRTAEGDALRQIVLVQLDDRAHLGRSGIGR